ncbi:15566_t:CDS:2 [Entrophospora sp. SA101]|nr:15566_t:CDS:2 [Entrophospora sp. SA101]
MGHSKKQKLHKIVQHILSQIIIPSELEKILNALNSPIQLDSDKQDQNIQIFLMKRKTLQCLYLLRPNYDITALITAIVQMS